MDENIGIADNTTAQRQLKTTVVTSAGEQFAAPDMRTAALSNRVDKVVSVYNQRRECRMQVSSSRSAYLRNKLKR